MDEEEFRKILNQFPVVRSRDYRAEDEAGSKNVSVSSERDKQVMDWHDAWERLDAEETAVERSEKEDIFWMHLRSSVEQKICPTPGLSQISGLSSLGKLFIKAMQGIASFKLNPGILSQGRRFQKHLWMMGVENAKQFCKAFQKVHEQLVYRALPLEAVRRITAHLESNSS